MTPRDSHPTYPEYIIADFEDMEEVRPIESPASFTVRDALNPYRQALLEGGIVASDPIVAEQRDMTVDLIQLIKQDQSSYQGAGLNEWARSLNNLESRLAALSPEKRGIIEQEIKDGAIPVFMPGKDIQFGLTLEQLTKQFKPLWIKDSQPQTVADTFLEWDHFINLIQTKAKELLADVPDKPYILFTKPTQAPAYSMNPHEYAAVQKCFTERLPMMANGSLSTVDPLDKNTWTRFIHLSLSSDGDVPDGYFNPDDRRLRFNWGDAASADAKGGFRLSVRTEI